MPVLQVLFDSVHADVLVISCSSLSIAATWLTNENTKIIAPSGIKEPFKSYDDFLLTEQSVI